MPLGPLRGIPSETIWETSSVWVSRPFPGLNHCEWLTRNAAFVVRVPHAPRNTFKSVWAFALSWDTQTGVTCGLFDGVSDHDLTEFSNYLNTAPEERSHPLSRLTSVSELLLTYYASYRRELESQLFKLEHRLSITRGDQRIDAWSWNQMVFRDMTRQCSGVMTGLVYLDRRIHFASTYLNFLRDTLLFLDHEVLQSHIRGEELRKISRKLEEAVLNNQNFVANQLHQVLCLQKRSQTLTNVVRDLSSSRHFDRHLRALD